MSFSLTWKVTQQEVGMVLRDYLRTKKQISKRLLTDIKFSGGMILCNGQEVTVRYKVQVGDEVTIIFPKETRSESLQSTEMPLNILYEDDVLLIVNKPAGIPTIPSRFHPDYSLANGILYYYEKKKIQSTIHIVNRLDRDTSGVVIVAKHRFIHSLLSIEQKQNRLKRTYEALVSGVVREQKGTIDLPIGRKEGSIIERAIDENGQQAITHFEVLRSFQSFTHLRLTLETGRTHQIRVHMQAYGHPLLGDELYGGEKIEINRQALHSKEAIFIHPLTGETLTIVAPLAEDMKAVIQKNAIP
ncbi:MAG TPA: RluA family pseudouridine synthase [Massilibacterium sp.]|nr:RluA family pseudouridine synthase [Massilibacterium sp.]